MKAYKVCGNRDTLGHAPGETFQAEIPEAQERRLVQSGNLEIVVAQAPARSEEAPQQPQGGSGMFGHRPGERKE